jgi:hypothetical protein
MDTMSDTPMTTPPPEDDPRSPENIARRQALGIAERDVLGRLLPGSVLSGAGRKPDAMNITALARIHTDVALKLLRDAVVDEKAPMAARVTAAGALLDRGWGKAPVQIDIQMRSRFDDFLRDVGVTARYEFNQPAALIEAIDDGNDAENGTTDGRDP